MSIELSANTGETDDFLSALYGNRQSLELDIDDMDEFMNKLCTC